MSDYLPPIENVPIFDSRLFERSVVGSGGGGDGLTEAEADLLYLKWPVGQNSPGETLNGPTFMTGPLQVAGATTMSSTATVSGDLTANQDIIMTNVGSYLQFPDATQQTTAFKIISPPIPVGAYANSNITVNAYGQITSAASGTGGGSIISQTAVAGGSLGTLVPINVPAGTARLKVVMCSGGGQQGTNFLDGATMYAGGSGAAGSMAIVNFDLGALPYSFSGHLLDFGFFTPTTARGGNVVALKWSTTATAYYGGFLPTSTSKSICTLNGGAPGGNASAGTPGTAGQNASQSAQIILSATNYCLSRTYAQGQNGVQTPGFNYATSTVAQPRPMNPMADYNSLRTLIYDFTNGGYSTYTTGSVVPTPNGTGGVVITFFA